MSGVFINYRGDDSDTAAAMIDHHLTARLGSDRVFLDSRSIPAGADFVEELLGRLRTCSVLLVVIGPRWLTLTNAAGERRIDDPQDWIRREIFEALSHRLRVIPVLIGDTRMPTEADLPEDIAGLSRRQYVPLRHRYTAVDLAFLVDQIADGGQKLAAVPAARHQLEVGRGPQQLPATVVHFAGRARELATLTGLLRGRAETGGTVIAAISGTAGVGKTALAVHWAHQVADRFPDGQLYVNLRGFDSSGQIMSSAEAVRRFLDTLDVPPERIPVELDAQAALYRSQLAGQRMLVVLDNARDSTQIRPLLPGAPGCLVVVTSRNQLTSLIADGAHPITLDLLTDDEARQLLTRRLGAGRVAAETHAVAEITISCARLPLALVLVAARAAVRPPGGLHLLADELSDTQRRWETLVGDDPASNVQAVFSWSYQDLSPPAARLFRLLGLHSGPDIAVPAAASLGGVTVGMARLLLAELTQASLLVEHDPGRYTFHDLLRAYATDLAYTTDSGQQRRVASNRILDHYLHSGYTAARLLDPRRDPLTLTAPQPGVVPEHPADYQQALNWFSIEHPVLLAAVYRAAAAGFDAHAWQLAWSLWTFLGLRGHWHDWAATCGVAVGAAHRLADRSAEALASRLLAGAYTRLGRFDAAHTQLTHALSLATQVDDRIGQARIYHSLAYLWDRRGNYAQALNHAQQALDRYRAASHQHGQADALNHVGWCHARLGDYQQSLAYCQQALTLHQQLGDRAGQANTWDSLGYAHHRLGHRTRALTCYQQALTLHQDLGDRYSEATILSHLGDTYHAAGNSQAARDSYRQALAILDDLNHSDADQVRNKLAAWSQKLDQVDDGTHRGDPIQLP